jgi:hypothetical protein
VYLKSTGGSNPPLSAKLQNPHISSIIATSAPCGAIDDKMFLRLEKLCQKIGWARNQFVTEAVLTLIESCEKDGSVLASMNPNIEARGEDR